MYRKSQLQRTTSSLVGGCSINPPKIRKETCRRGEMGGNLKLEADGQNGGRRLWRMENAVNAEEGRGSHVS